MGVYVKLQLINYNNYIIISLPAQAKPIQANGRASILQQPVRNIQNLDKLGRSAAITII